jgi:hypothetical protein
VGAGVLAGVTLAPVSACMRVAWGTADRTGDRTSAYSLVYLTQELSILAGPLLLAAVLTLTNASAALLTIAAVTCVGTLGFTASLPAGPGPGATASAERTGGVLRASGMRALIGATILVGGVIGGIQVGVPTFATAHHSPAASGLLIAVLSIGGIAGATIYGGRRWHLTPTGRLLGLLAALSVAAVLSVAAPTLVVLGLVLVLAGLPLNPSLTTISLLVDTHVSQASATEAFGWLSTGIAGGTGAASAIAGAVSHPGHPRPAFVVAAVAAVSATVLVAAVRRTLAAGPAGT